MSAPSAWTPRRFWTSAVAARTPDGWQVELDGKPVRTPAKAPLLLPSAALAEMVAREWDAQQERIDPASMPATRMANSAIDKLSQQHAEVAAIVAAYGETDLLCHRADHPAELVALQSAWDAPLDWAEQALGARLVPVQGLMPAAQDPAALAALHRRVAGMPDFVLAPFHDLVALSGSLVLGFAAAEAHLGGAEAWALSRIDEEFSARQWGRDDEADAAAARRETEFFFALQFLGTVKG